MEDHRLRVVESLLDSEDLALSGLLNKVRSARENADATYDVLTHEGMPDAVALFERVVRRCRHG